MTTYLLSNDYDSVVYGHGLPSFSYWIVPDSLELAAARIERLEAENKELRKVLKCYADAGFEMARAALFGKEG